MQSDFDMAMIYQAIVPGASQRGMMDFAFLSLVPSPLNYALSPCAITDLPHSHTHHALSRRPTYFASTPTSTAQYSLCCTSCDNVAMCSGICMSSLGVVTQVRHRTRAVQQSGGLHDGSLQVPQDLTQLYGLLSFCGGRRHSSTWHRQRSPSCLPRRARTSRGSAVHCGPVQ